MNNECKSCEICGVTSDKKIIQFVSRVGMYLCSKHKKQIYEYGHITDPTSRTTHDKNEYILHDDHAEMILRDRTNNVVGFALIDIDDVDRCKEHKWSLAKKDKGQPYVRAKNTKENLGLHRFIMYYNGELVVDHINRNTLDNRKCNLRIATVAENVANNGHPGIYQIYNGRWKVRIRRYGKQFYSYGSGFELYDEAVAYRYSILKYVEEHKEEMKREYENDRKGQRVGTCLMPNGKWQCTYNVNGKRIRESGFPTMEAAANRRAEMIGGVANVC